MKYVLNRIDFLSKCNLILKLNVHGWYRVNKQDVASSMVNRNIGTIIEL